MFRRHRLEHLATVEATSEQEAIAKVAERLGIEPARRFKMTASKLNERERA
jgi:hypothetical protein